MLFARSWMLMLFGIFMFTLSLIVGMFIPFMITIIFFLLGAILTVVSLLLIQLRSYDGGLNNLLEDRKKGHVNWLYVYGDYDIHVTPAVRQLEKHTYSKKLDQQIVDFKTYNFAGHKIRIVPEGVGHSTDLGKCIYATHAKRVWNMKSIDELRDSVRNFLNKKKPSSEKVTSIKEYKEIKDENKE